MQYNSSANPLTNLETCLLGEGPVWHEERATFFWVDIERKKIYEWNPETFESRSWTMDRMVSTIVPETYDHLIVALQGSVSRFHISTGHLHTLALLEENYPNIRTNDGKCDPAGRLWIGTMHMAGERGAGSLFCISNEGVIRKLHNLSVPNGMAWSKDDRYFYFIDSVTYNVDRYFFDRTSGDIRLDKTVIQVPEEYGMPDGMSIDDEGMLWIGHWNGFAVMRWNANTGELMGKISCGVPQVTSCCFGGRNLDQLFITSAAIGLEEGKFAEFPLSGKPFLIEAPVKGVATNSYQG